MSVLGTIVLLFQALLLAHGGLTTLGANAFAMAIVGPLVAYGLFRLTQRGGMPLAVSLFVAASVANLTTYVTTALQLALAFPSEIGGIATSFTRFLGIFALTSVPLAISEGIMTVILVKALLSQSAPAFRNTYLQPRS